jgi:hypothetical protein
MELLKRKNSESKPKKTRSLQEIVTERVLTAEGWRRRELANETTGKSKKKK